MHRPLVHRVGISVFTLLSVFTSGSMLVSQTPAARSVVYTSQMRVPAETELSEYAPVPTPAQVQGSLAAAMMGAGRSLEQSFAAVPPVPWGRYGLADVRIESDSITWNADRQRYEVALDDGRTAVLTLRRQVQEHLESIMGQYPEPGEAAVVVEADTGRVLALADDATGSSVGADLALRPVAYAASTFKVVTAAALLFENEAGLTDEQCFSGGSSGFNLAALDASGGPTCSDVIEAMAHSTNLYFGRMADQRLEPEQLQHWAERFGYNMRVPFEMPLQPSVARIPDDRLEFARSAAGFRHTWLSPLHGALIQATIENEGVMMVPTIVAHIEDPQGVVVWQHSPVEWRTVATADQMQTLHRTLERTCSSGTARNFFHQRSGWPTGVEVAGKTGTLSNRPVSGPDPDPLHTYTWFTGASDLGSTTVAVAGLVVSSPTWHIKGSYLAAEAVLETHASLTSAVAAEQGE
jgi:peptidoglycan glycosyltransferase